MRKFIFSVFMLFVFCCSCFAQLNVISRTPAGVIQADLSDTAISVSFNKPVAALGEQANIDGAACPVQVSPAVQGQCRWAGTQTLIFTPQKPFTPATKYTVTVKAGIKAAATDDVLNNDVVWSFSTAAPKVLQTIPYNGEQWISPEPQIMIAFNIPVDINSFGKYGELILKGSKLSFTAQQITGEFYDKYFKYSDIPAENIIMVKPSSPLEKGAKYKFIVNRGLAPREGNITMAKDAVFSFSTYGPLKLLQNPKTNCLPFNPSLIFSNPVAAGEVYKNISFTPALDFKPCDESNFGWPSSVKQNSASVSGYNIPLCGLYFKPSQIYKVKISGNLTDIFGGKLGKDAEFEWSNSGYCPSIDFKGGFGVIESYLKPYHPASAVNVQNVPVEKQKIDYKDFIPFYKKDINWCAKRNLSGAFVAKAWSPSITRDEGVNTFINLGEALNPLNAGIVFTQFLNPAQDGQKACWKNAFDVVTDIGLTIKTSPEDILIWATYLKDGSPAKNKEVELRDYKNNLLWQGKTDKNGIAFAPGWNSLNIEKEDSWRAPEIWAFVKDGDNVAVISSYFNDGVEPWRFNINYDYSQESEPYKAFIFTDRGVYRTGEDVYIKAVIRKLQEGRFVNAADINSVSLSIRDPRGQEVLSKTLDIGKTSAADYKYSISSSAPTGTYSVEIKIWDYSFSQNFRAEAVKPAEFNVELTPLAKQYFPKETAAFAINAQYQFGAALADAEVKWNAKITPYYFSPAGWEGYNFSDYFTKYEDKEDDILNTTGKLDEKGSSSLDITVPQVERASSLYVQAGVLSPQKQQLFARKSVTVLPSDIFIGIKTDSSVFEAGQPLTAQIVTVNAKGELVPNKNIEGRLIRRDYVSARKTGISGRLEWVSSQREVNVADFIINSKEGKTEWSYTPTQSGSYYIVLSAADGNGRKNTSASSFYISDGGSAYWQQSDDDILQLAADKESYEVGQKAKILIKSPVIGGYALITAERDGVLYKDTIKIKSSAQTVKLPILKSFAPNVFVSVVLVQGRSGENVFNKSGEDLAKPKAKFGYLSLDVSPSAHKLSAQIKTDKTAYEPRQTVTADIDVKNYKGKGTGATLSVYAVDEGILALSAYKTPDIFAYFYSARPLSVSSADNRLFLIGLRSFGQKGENRGGGGSGSKLGGIDLRSNFKFTPFWSATVDTDKKGHAKVSFVLPDNLTKFRIMVVAAGQEDFGSAQSDIEVSKPVVIKPFLPRFARLGDIFDCGFVVYNYTKAEDVQTALNSAVEGGIVFRENPQTSAVIKAGGSITVKGRCFAQNAKEAVFKFSAQNAQGSDGLTVKLPVLETASLEAFASADATKTSIKISGEKPAKMLAGKDNILEVIFASGAALNTYAAKDYLDKYPYYCLEQRLSKLVPYVFGAGADKAAAQASIDKIFNYQTPYGGFAYWPSSKYADPYVTAYALDILFAAQQAGYSVDKEMLQKAVLWLNSYISKKQDTAYKYNFAESSLSKAYAVYALALYGQNNAGAYFSNLYAQRDSLGLEAQIYLLKAASVLKLSNAADTLKQSILNYAKISNTEIHFEAPKNNMWIYSDNVKTTALALDAMLAGGGFDGEYKTVNWLNNTIKYAPDFGTTADNAAVYRALSNYAALRESAPADFTATLKINGKTEQSAVFNAEEPKIQTFYKNLNGIFAKDNKVQAEFAKEGQGTLYYKAMIKYYVAPSASAQNAGFAVSKVMTPAAPLAQGQSATIKVTVTSDQNRSFVVLEDFLPAGVEIVDSSLATEQDEDEQEPNEDYTPQPFIRTENYDDRVAAFADFMPKGTYTFSYKVRAVAAGNFYVPEAKVSQMYMPDVFGTSDGGNILQIK